MKRNYLINIFLIGVILIFAVGIVSAADEAADNATLSTKDVKSFDEIQDNVNNAGENDVIDLKGNYESSGKEIKVTKSLTFLGSDNAVLDAKGKSNIFYAPKRVSLTFKNIQFLNSKEFAIGTNNMLGDFDVHIINCSFKNSGDIAVSTYGANLIVENSRFENNYQAIQDYTCPVTINNCTFINNAYTAIQAGDATIRDSFFISNGNKDYGGGAIFASDLNIYKSEFINNTACEYGGAIHAGYGGRTSIFLTNFINNNAGYLGGGIYLDHNCLSLDGCSFINNSASNGAAIYSSKSALDVKNSNFTKNNAVSSVIYSDAASSFKNTIFKDNVRFTIISSKVNLVNCNLKSKTFNGWVCLDDNLDMKDFIRISLNEIYTYYKSGKKLYIKLINTKDNSKISKCKVKVVIKSDEKTYTKYLTTNSKGVASFDISGYNVGRYNLFVSIVDSKLKQISIEEIDEIFIYKALPAVKAPKVKFKYKKSKYFKVTIKNKKTKKPISKLKIKLKIYTGKKYKIYKIKTNKKGIAKFNTKKLKRGKHKVIISSANANYRINKKSQITIR